jgi:hypothetical protein
LARARPRAAIALAQAGLDDNEEGRIELALADIRAIFDQEALDRGGPPDGDDRLASADLADRLAAIEGRPWGEYGKNEKPITTHALARLLGRKPLGITPQVIRTGPATTARGYYRRQFEDAWARYLPHLPHSPRQTVTT